jgi:hypothetical protein
MSAVPGAIPVTTPEGDTVATVESDVFQRKLPGIRPEPSLAVAASSTVPAGTTVAVSVEIVTTGGIVGGGPTTLSLPSQERTSQPSATDLMTRRVFRSGPHAWWDTLRVLRPRIILRHWSYIVNTPLPRPTERRLSGVLQRLNEALAWDWRVILGEVSAAARRPDLVTPGV